MATTFTRAISSICDRNYGSSFGAAVEVDVGDIAAASGVVVEIRASFKICLNSALLA